jgi:hypothetical protein
MSRRKTAAPTPPAKAAKPDVVWLYDISDMMCGVTFCVYDRFAMKLLRDDSGTMHFPTAEAATAYAAKLAKKHAYDDLVRELPWR